MSKCTMSLCHDWPSSSHLPVELHNSQIIVKGCETAGFVIVSAAKAKVFSCSHMPVWVRDNQLRSKDTWSGSLECMQVVWESVFPMCICN